MYQQKTKETDQSVLEFIEKIEHPRRKEEAYQLLDLFSEASGHPAKMWGPSIIGFGSIHYKYPTGHEGDMALVGFTPRKAKISIYSMLDADKKQAFLTALLFQQYGKIYQKSHFPRNRGGCHTACFAKIAPVILPCSGRHRH